MPSLKRGLLSPVLRSQITVRFKLFTAFSLCSLFTIHYSLSPVTAHASEFSILPSIAVSEEYTDNVFQTQAERKTEFISHLSPGLAFQYRAPFWDWDLVYHLDYRYYARNSQKGEFSHNLDTKGTLRVIENFLFLDISDTYKKVSLDVNRDTTTTSNFVNQTDQNILNFAPHIEFHPGANFQVNSGYHFTKVSYPNASSGNNTTSSGVGLEEQGAFIATLHELSPKSTLTTNFAYAHINSGQGSNTGQVLSYNRLIPSLAIRYEYAEKSFISMEGGYSWFLYDNGPSDSNPFWKATLTHAFDHMLLSLNSNVTYNTDPLQGSTEARNFSARLDKTMSRGSMGFIATYSELINNQQGKLDSKNYQIGVNIKHDLTEKMTGHLDLTGVKVNANNNNNINNDITLPYQFYIGAGVSYTLVNNLTLALDYNYTTYRHSIDSAKDNIEINRVILGLTKSFGKPLEKGDVKKGPNVL